MGRRLFAPHLQFLGHYDRQTLYPGIFICHTLFNFLQFCHIGSWTLTRTGWWITKRIHDTRRPCLLGETRGHGLPTKGTINNLRTGTRRRDGGGDGRRLHCFPPR